MRRLALGFAVPAVLSAAAGAGIAAWRGDDVVHGLGWGLCGGGALLLLLAATPYSTSTPTGGFAPEMDLEVLRQRRTARVSEGVATFLFVLGGFALIVVGALLTIV